MCLTSRRESPDRPVHMVQPVDFARRRSRSLVRWHSPSIHQPFGPNLLQDRRGDFLDRLGGCRQPANFLTPHHGFGLVNFIAAIEQAGIGGVGPALVADLAQAFRRNRQAENLFPMRHKRRRQLPALEIFGNQRVV